MCFCCPKMGQHNFDSVNLSFAKKNLENAWICHYHLVLVCICVLESTHELRETFGPRGGAKSFAMKCFYAHAMLSTLSIWRTPFTNGMYFKRSCAHVCLNRNGFLWLCALSKCSWLSRQLTFWLGDSNLKIKFTVAWKLMMGKIFKLQKVVVVYTRQFTNFPNLCVVSK